MHLDRLSDEVIGGYLADCSDDACDIVLALRSLILKTAPKLSEAIRFNALCYFKPNHPFGAIGGNVCMIDCRKGTVELAFIHGAFLSDPLGLLQGIGKAKRHIQLRSVSDVR